MNKRFKELAQQAFYDEATSQPSNQMYTFSEYKMEKFAELIVRECLNMIENEAVQYAEPVWAIELVNDIKEHFGVEL